MLKMYSFRILLFAVAFLFNVSALLAQFSKVEIGVDGLTCSMCTRSTELSIRKLDFVDSVKMDLTNTNGVITFKKGMPVSVEKIAQAVKNAGFSVRYLKADFSLASQVLSL
jgi:copper chaperone CopZ